MRKVLFVVLLSFAALVVSVLVAGTIALQKEPWGERVAVIPIKGVISSQGGFLTGEAVDANWVVDTIRSANDNPSVKAIVLEIDSPGGSPVASDEIARAVKGSKKPTVAWIGELGASGAYWIASSANRVVAHRMSITGSIGAYTEVVQLEGLMEKLGVREEMVKSGKYKDIGTPFRNITPEEKEIFGGMIKNIYDEFVLTVSENRNLSLNYTYSIADGRPYLGKEAKELGLVDELGNRKDAIRIAAGLANSTTEKTLEYAKEKSPFADLLQNSAASFGYGFGKSLSGAFRLNA